MTQNTYTGTQFNDFYLKPSKVANEIIIRESAIRKNGWQGYSLSYQRPDKSTETFLFSAINSTNLCRAFAYPPLDPISPAITLELISRCGNNTSISFTCANWDIEFNEFCGDTLRGNIRIPTDFCIRPFQLIVDGKDCTYDFSIKKNSVKPKYLSQSSKMASLPFLISLPFSLKQDEGYLIARYNHKRSTLSGDYSSICSKYITNSIHHSLLKPLPIERSSPAQPRPSKRSVAILMPIYNGYSETLSALHSLSRYLDHNASDLNIRLLLGLDNPKNHRLNKQIVSSYSSCENVCVFANRVNLGFVKNCNKLFSFVRPEEDILLVNSDIIAPNRNWIERLVEWLDIDHSIGTVTPLSNQASIYSFPLPNQAQETMGSLSVDQTDDLLAGNALVNGTPIIETPSCHGFCTLIAHSRIGLEYLFDEEFGRGYGEENDLSCRISKKYGFRNIAAPNVYVYHRESVSFSSEKSLLIKINYSKVCNKHPYYHEAVARYCSLDPLREIRNQAVIQYLHNLNNKRKSILHISHWRGGGTDKYIRGLVEASPQFMHLGLRPYRQRLGYVELFQITTEEDERKHPAAAIFSEDQLRGSANLLASDFNVSKVVVHSLIDYLSFGDVFSLWSCFARRFYHDVIIHDYHWINPHQDLLSIDSKLINPWPQLSFDINNIRLRGKRAAKFVLSDNLEVRSRSAFSFLQYASKVLFPSKSAFEVISRHLPVSNLSAEIKPHDNTDCIASNLVTSENPSKSCKIKHDIVVAVIGSIGNNKGFKLLAEVVNYARQENFPLHFTVIGTTMNNSQILSYGNVSITGKYQERDFQRLVESARPDCALFLSPWPETYSYTLSLAFANGIFPFVLDIGAQSERVRQAGFGVVLNSDSPSFIVRKIMNTFLDHSRA